MRAKILVQSVTDFGNFHKVDAIPVCDQATPENQSFNLSTPTGKIELGIANPMAFGFLKPGQQYYVDFTPAIQQTTVVTNPDGTKEVVGVAGGANA